MTTVMTVRGMFRRKRREVLLAGVKPGDVVLDYGCGIGFSTLAAAKIVGNQGKVYALDVNPLAIKAVKTKAKKKRLENVETILSGLDTGLSNESIDVILLYNVLPMVKNPPALIQELYRVLKPAGTLAYKTGKGAEVSSGRSYTTDEVTKLMEDNGPLKLERKIGKFYIFSKSDKEM